MNPICEIRTCRDYGKHLRCCSDKWKECNIEVIIKIEGYILKVMEEGIKRKTYVIEKVRDRFCQDEAGKQVYDGLGEKKLELFDEAIFNLKKQGKIVDGDVTYELRK